MSESKHTPGPWTVEAYPDRASRHPLHNNRYVASPGGLVCALRDQPAQAADARLIAAAPELLAALRRIIDWNHSEHTVDARVEAMVAGRAAINKAEEG